MERYNEFAEFMLEYTELFEDISYKEEEKFHAMLSDDLSRIEQSLNEHQTSIKLIEQYENRREALQKEMGLEGKTFREIINMCKGEEKAELSEIYSRFELAIHNTNHFNKSAMKVADMNIKLSGGSEGVSDPRCYDSKGVSKEEKNAGFLDRKA